MGVCRLVLQILTRISDQKMQFSTPVFRPCYWAEIMLSLLRLERKQENSSNPFRIRIFSFLFYSFGIETINTFIHSRSSLKNYTRFQTKMGKVQTRFQTKPRKNPTRWGGTYLYSLCKGVPPPPRLDFNRYIDYITAGMRECRLKAHYSLNHCGTMRAVDISSKWLGNMKLVYRPPTLKQNSVETRTRITATRQSCSLSLICL